MNMSRLLHGQKSLDLSLYFCNPWNLRCTICRILAVPTTRSHWIALEIYQMSENRGLSVLLWHLLFANLVDPFVQARLTAEGPDNYPKQEH